MFLQLGELHSFAQDRRLPLLPSSPTPCVSLTERANMHSSLSLDRKFSREQPFFWRVPPLHKSSSLFMLSSFFARTGLKYVRSFFSRRRRERREGKLSTFISSYNRKKKSSPSWFSRKKLLKVFSSLIIHTFVASICFFKSDSSLCEKKEKTYSMGNAWLDTRGKESLLDILSLFSLSSRNSSILLSQVFCERPHTRTHKRKEVITTTTSVHVGPNCSPPPLLP